MNTCKQLNRRVDDLLQLTNVQPRERRKNPNSYTSEGHPKRRMADKVLPMICVTMATYIENKQNKNRQRYQLAMTALNEIILQYPNLSIEQQYEMAYDAADQQLQPVMQ